MPEKNGRRGPGLTHVWLRMLVLIVAMLLTILFLAFLASRIISDSAQDDLTSGNIEKAEESSRRAHRLNPYAVEPMLAQAHTAAAMGNYIDAQRIILSAIELEPERSSLYEELAQLEFYDLNNNGQAISYLMSAIDRDPQSDSLHIQLHRMVHDAAIYDETGFKPGRPEDK